MTAHRFDDFSQYFHNWQKNVINFTLKRNLSNKELENYIKSFRNIDSEIFKSLFAAKEFYIKKRRYYKEKIKKLKQQEIDFKKLLDYAYKERKKVTEPKIKDEISTSINHIKNSIEKLEHKINICSTKIVEETLDLDEENNIIEEIQSLDRDKKVNLRHLKTLEVKLRKEMQNDMFFKTVRTIEILEVSLKGINRNLNKWSNRKVKTHNKMLNLYRKAKEFEKIKIQIERELLGAKQLIDKNLSIFYEQKNKSQKQAFQEQVRILKNRIKNKEVERLKTKYIVKKKRTKKKFEKEKLAIARGKQKSGKKLDFYELKLILEHSKKKE